MLSYYWLFFVLHVYSFALPILPRRESQLKQRSSVVDFRDEERLSWYGGSRKRESWSRDRIILTAPGAMRGLVAESLEWFQGLGA